MLVYQRVTIIFRIKIATTGGKPHFQTQKSHGAGIRVHPCKVTFSRRGPGVPLLQGFTSFDALNFGDVVQGQVQVLQLFQLVQTLEPRHPVGNIRQPARSSIIGHSWISYWNRKDVCNNQISNQNAKTHVCWGHIWPCAIWGSHE